MSEQEVVKQEVKDVRRNYTRTPNVLFESYPDLRPQEKWLYINLVYLCGSKGTRHLSLRYIHDRTDISLGALSGHKDPKKNDPGMIRRLHNAGLIHAEIKRKIQKSGKESDQAQYHITIVDIWQLNETFFASKRSESEHSIEASVQIPNSSVRNLNTSEGERSESERERSENDTKVILQSKTTDSNNTEQDSNSDTRTSLSSLSNDALLAELQRRGALPPTIPNLEKVEPDRSGDVHDPKPPDSDASLLPTTEQSVVVNATPPLKPKRGARKPKAPTSTISAEDNARIDTFLACMDRAARDALEEETKEASDFSFTRTKKDRELIYEFLSGRTISEKQICAVYMAMWKSPPGRDGFQWKDNISIAAFCRNYDKMLLKAMSTTNKAAPLSKEEERAQAEKRNEEQLEKMLARSEKLKREKEEKDRAKSNGNKKAASNVGV